MATYIKKDFASPNGPILLLSAKGSTTASIAVADGVKDFSGNGNHGKGNNGVTVEKYGGYDCFGFPNNNSYIYLSDKISTIFTQGSAYTYSVSFIVTSKPTRSNGILIMWSYSMPANQIWLTSDYKINVSANADFSAYTASTAVELDKLYTVTVSADYASGVRHIYVNGVLVSTSIRTAGNITLNVTYMILGNHSGSTGYNLPGYIIDARIYPRALSAAEVKYLYNGFQPNLIMGQTIPSGAILDLSARGLTTAGIAQANGVVDRSGNGNHGQAYNGVAVVNDDEMGSCFSFDGSNDVIAIGSNNLSSYFNDMEEMSLSLLLRVNAVNTSSQYLVSFKTQVSASNQSWICLWLDASTRRISFSGRWKESDWGNPWTGSEYFLTADLGTVYHATVVCDFKNGVFKAYVNGVLVQTTDNLRTGNLRALYDGNNVFFGALNDTPQYGLNCSLADIRIYPRALTASEVQQLADASLKKITNIKSGSSDVRQIFSNGEMIYAKTNDYSLNL